MLPPTCTHTPSLRRDSLPPNVGTAVEGWVCGRLNDLYLLLTMTYAFGNETIYPL
jgi:hypothetical protein